jgi:hypothetical protein
LLVWHIEASGHSPISIRRVAGGFALRQVSLMSLAFSSGAIIDWPAFSCNLGQLQSVKHTHIPTRHQKEVVERLPFLVGQIDVQVRRRCLWEQSEARQKILPR